ncbi:MAG: excinuclease ABC subunit UvrA [Phycisphaeraceae bacterium]|nr:excinuclease ABC subunit UvrA [Phycisphaeraceae bacterium]
MPAPPPPPPPPPPSTSATEPDRAHPKSRRELSRVVEVKAASDNGLKRSSAYENRVIHVRGAREHNLKNIDVTIPRDKLVVITGLSGSGKSSLAFDTIFAEGQRKYMESLSAYARQFLEQLKKPDVDEVEGVPPTIAIEQRSASSNPRSTVATTTEIYDYLRLLFARCGTPHSWAPTKARKDGAVLERSGRVISAMGSSQIVDAIMARTGELSTKEKPARFMILAPIVRGKKGFHREVLEDLVKQGWARARINGKLLELRDVLKDPGENPLKLGRFEKHSIDAVIDRISFGAEARQRVAESVEAALRVAEGTAVVSIEDASGNWKDATYSTRFSDPDHPQVALEELEPRLFSFNSPQGACKVCSGLGTLLELDETLVMPNESKSLAEGAIEAYAKNMAVRAWFQRGLKKFCKAFGVDYNAPISTYSKDQRQMLFYGYAGDPASGKVSKLKIGSRGHWQGVIPELTEWWGKTKNPTVKEWLGQFISTKECEECRGDRLRLEALHVLLTSAHKADTAKAFSKTVIGRPKNDGTMLNIAEFSRLNILDALEYIGQIKLTREQQEIAEPILKEINNRLRFLTGVGLEYLSLDRKTATLSGGEAQRIRLATQVGSGLVGACYVLDEPTIGLHQRDNDRLIKTLRHLADIGNTVLVVEHDEDMIRAADHVLDVGPGPGVHGGRIVAQGTVKEICAAPQSLTGDYLSGRKHIPVPKARRKLDTKNTISVKGATHNNLKKIDVSVPTGGLVCVTGVSGSGKSTLVNDILLVSANNQLLGRRDKPGAHASFKWPKTLDRVIEVDQSPIGRTPRSNPATYVGIFDDIRKVFVATKEAKIRGYKPGRFSFNVRGDNGGGRCEACEGQGLKKIEMHFLPDVFVECEVCRGKRYNRETLEILYRGKSIADVLDMTIEQSLSFFENHPKILRFLKCLHDVGLDYITLGQPSTQLSGGEAQRIKLATELGKTFGALEQAEIIAAGSPSPDGKGLGKADSDAVSADSESDSDALEELANAKKGRGKKSKWAERFEAMRSRAANPYGKTLYVLDEPTTGLHFEDIRKLVHVFDRLAAAGHTLVVIEHNLDVIKCADWLIDLGPEGGAKGGSIVAQGTPEQVASVRESYTGQYLKGMLK